MSAPSLKKEQGRFEVPMAKLQHVDTKLDTWGDRSNYVVAKEDMPPAGEAYVMQPKNYSKQPETITRLPDGSGKIELFWSRGD
jgi:hypothetical protein